MNAALMRGQSRQVAVIVNQGPLPCELNLHLRFVRRLEGPVDRLVAVEHLAEGFGGLALDGREDEDGALRDEQRGVQGEGADDGTLTRLPAAVEQDHAFLAEQHVALPGINGEAAGAEGRTGVEGHRHELARVHRDECRTEAGARGRHAIPAFSVAITRPAA